MIGILIIEKVGRKERKRKGGERERERERKREKDVKAGELLISSSSQSSQNIFLVMHDTSLLSRQSDYLHQTHFACISRRYLSISTNSLAKHYIERK